MIDSAATQTNRRVQHSAFLSLATILILALTLRAIALVVTAPTSLINDELDYHAQANQLVSGLPLGDANGRSPGVILMYAGLYRTFGASPHVARVANVVLDVACVGLVFLIGSAITGRRGGLVAASLAALYPSFIGFSHSLWSEPLYMTCSLTGLALVLAHRERPASWKLVAAGLALGLSALTREVGVPVALLVAGWLAFEGRPKLATGALRAALLLLPVICVLLPWSAKVHSETGQLVLSGGTTWFNLYVGNGDPVNIRGRTVLPWSHYPNLGKTRGEREKAARTLTLQAIANHMPWWPFEKLRELRNLFSPESFTVKRLSFGPGSRRSPPAFGRGNQGYSFRFDALNSWAFRRGAILACIASYMILMLCGSAGLMLARDRGGVRLFLLFIFAHVTPTLIAFALTRHRLPFMMLMTVTSASFITGLPECWRGASRSRRVATVVVMTFVLAIMLSGIEPLS